MSICLQEASFDKQNGVIELKTFSLYAVILTLWKKGQEKGVNSTVSNFKNKLLAKQQYCKMSLYVFQCCWICGTCVI